MNSAFLSPARRLAPALLAAALAAAPASAQNPVCARAKIVIMQELTLERVGFEATLEITNNDGADPITDFSASLTFENPLLSSNGVVNDSSGLFFVRQPELENIADVNGTGVIPPTQTMVARWFIVPKPSAGGTTPAGIRYKVGCNLAGRIRGADVPSDVMFAVADTIYVRPEPLLDIAYFQPRDVQADDPLTEIVESPVPFTLGVLVRNVGYGAAQNVRIRSQQPRIVENVQQLLLVPRLLGTRVMDEPLDRSTLEVNLGTLQPGESRKAAWDMITSLSGEFVEFRASFTHAPEFGGEETSIITNMAAHFMAHEVLNDLPGRDRVTDFLADVDRDALRLPETLFESQGNILPVNPVDTTFEGAAGPGLVLTLRGAPLVAGWTYLRIADPGQAKLPISGVVRNDGKALDPHNFWTSYHYVNGQAPDTQLHIFDFAPAGSNSYAVTYSGVTTDTNPPTTTIEFAGPVQSYGNTHHITPDTQIFFLSDDASPVSMVYSLTNGPVLPAYPFRLTVPGTYPIVYYATDAYSNRESNRTATLVVSAGAPTYSNFVAAREFVFLAGDAVSVRPSEAQVSVQIVANPTPVQAALDIFRGVRAAPQLRNVPSSPTRSPKASIIVHGQNVDFFRYRLDGSGWSAEADAATLLSVSGLAPGPHSVTVQGRSSHGAFPPDTEAVTASWVVNTNGPPTTITDAPSTPTRDAAALLTVKGAGVTNFRWTVDGGYYRAPAPAPGTIALARLSAATHTVAVLGAYGGAEQPTNTPTTVSWRVNPLHGYDQSTLPQVRHVAFSNVAAQTVSFAWDGRNDAGAECAPGWYTLRLTLVDALGQTNFAVRTLWIAEMHGTNAVLVESTRGPAKPDARGRYVAWHEQSDGNDEIYASDLGPGGTQRKLTDGILSQVNPRSDGRYAVWQGRQPDGSWDLYLADLSSAAAPTPLTQTPGIDEINPAIDWPWVVFQSKAAARPGDPWQVLAINLLSNVPFAVWAGPMDQLDPDVRGGAAVWQDWRDVGPGEIYYRNLESGRGFRVTTNSYGQYKPVVDGRWIAWQDNRHLQLEIYAFDLFRNAEIRLTDTPENETGPSLDGDWAVCCEDSLGLGKLNLRMIHLPSRRAIPLTRTETMKENPRLVSRHLLWLDKDGLQSRIQLATLPGLQAVFANANAVPVTDKMVENHPDAFSLLNKWHDEAGVTRLERFLQLTPQPVRQAASWEGGGPAGTNFPLAVGSFLWITFDQSRVLDLGLNQSETISLPAGVSAFSFTRFPSPFSAFRLVRQLGLDKVRAVRMLDSASGRWMSAEVRDGQLLGQDFPIPHAAVLLFEMAQPVNNWRPE